MGYVGLSLATLISRKHQVVAVEIVAEKVKMLKDFRSPIRDKEIEAYLSTHPQRIMFTNDIHDCIGVEYAIIATPTNYNAETHYFDTSSVETVATQLRSISPDTLIVIKSTIPAGFTDSLNKKLGGNIIFSPEFLREGKALYDNLHPSRIIVGISRYSKVTDISAQKFVDILRDCSEKPDVATLVTGSNEAESIKLFSNTYLAMRVAFFNELDIYAETKDLNSVDLIRGICLDPRIGDYYNNPSFGYGGYCLPKDTKQLLANYEMIPNSLIKAIVDSNNTRKEFIKEQIESKVDKNAIIGVYRLIMKSNSDNFRESSIVDIMHRLESDGYNLVVYEPTMTGKFFEKYPLVTDLHEFKNQCSLIVSNRMSEELNDCREKVYCRDIFFRD